MFNAHRISLGLLAAGLAPTTTSGSAQAAGDQGGVPWWVWVLIAVVLLALLLWWWLRSRRGSEAVQTQNVETLLGTPVAAPEAAPAPAEKAPVAEVPVAADDLKLVEGIGPKIAGILEAAGITTFAQLAATDVSRLKQILADADFTAPANPDTWPEQAGLAAAGKWAELEALQDGLKGGRRV